MTSRVANEPNPQRAAWRINGVMLAHATVPTRLMLIKVHAGAEGLLSHAGMMQEKCSRWDSWQPGERNPDRAAVSDRAMLTCWLKNSDGGLRTAVHAKPLTWL